MHNDDYTQEMLDTTLKLLGRDRPQLLFMDEHLLKSKSKQIVNEVINRETDGKPMRVTIEIVTTKKRVTKIREFDPENNYEDGLEVFKEKS